MVLYHCLVEQMWWSILYVILAENRVPRYLIKHCSGYVCECYIILALEMVDRPKPINWRLK
jgi:hypothetical protein